MNRDELKELFLDYLRQEVVVKQPDNLYKPVDYILQLGGKRLRPLLSLIAAQAFGEKLEKALDAALAVEVFHNFTLLHDDIMDQAPIRRGQPTVHKKWDLNTGILSGDVMLINAYQFLENYDASVYKQLTQVFSKTAVEVCEGQQYDMDFETRNNVTIPEYLMMIKYKTSVLVAAALQMGAIVAGATQSDQIKIYNFGIDLGLAFQLQDDYLDTFGNAVTFGKQIGGDILENKKTWLYLKTLEVASTADSTALLDMYQRDIENDSDKIIKVTELFQQYQIDVLLQKEISNYTQKALAILEFLNIEVTSKDLLKEFVFSLEKRSK